VFYESDGTHKTVRCEKSKQTFPVSIATQLAPSLLRVLLVGSQEEDFFLIREILVRNWNALPAELDHAGSLEEAKTMLQSGDYGLVLFEHETVDAAATKLLSEFLQTRGAMPFILLTEHADEKAVAEIIQAGAYDCMERSQLNGANLVRTIRCALSLHATQQQRHTAEQSLRKLSCAVEQSADTIFITNSEGIIEYVNPAFEALTGYSRQEVTGKAQSILKSELQTPVLYSEFMGEHSFRRRPRHRSTPKEEWPSVLRRREHQSHT